MANNYFQGTVEPSDLTITPAMAKALKVHGAGIEHDKPSVLDQLAKGDTNLHDVYIYFENGFDEHYEDEEKPDDELNDEEKEVRRLIHLSQEELFREILLLNPEADCIEYKWAAYCSRMRPGEFGGGALVVTRTHYLYLNDSHARVEKDGSITVTAKPEAFEVKQETAK